MAPAGRIVFLLLLALQRRLWLPLTRAFLGFGDDTSCPADMPETLMARLDAVAKRLDALADAVNTGETGADRFLQHVD